jgi:hypothetical protein
LKHSLSEMQVFSRACLLHNPYTAVCYRHYSHCTGTAKPCSKPVTAMNQACVYIKHIRTFRAQNTNVNKSLRKVSSTLQQCNECVSKLTKDTHITGTSRAPHKFTQILQPSCTSNVESNTQICGAIRRTCDKEQTIRIPARQTDYQDTSTTNRLSGNQHNRLSGYQHNRLRIPARQTDYQDTSTTDYQDTSTTNTQIPEPHANKTAAESRATVTDTQEVAILQEFLPNTTRAFLFSRTRVTGVARITSLT